MQFWSLSQKDRVEPEKMQRTARKMIKGLEGVLLWHRPALIRRGKTWQRGNMATVHKVLSGLERMDKDQLFIASSNTKTRGTTRGTTQNSRIKIQNKSSWWAFKQGVDNEGKCLSGSTMDAKMCMYSRGNWTLLWKRNPVRITQHKDSTSSSEDLSCVQLKAMAKYHTCFCKQILWAIARDRTLR